MQTGNKTRVADDVDDTCDEDEQERRFAVAKSAENRRQKVVGDDEEKYRCRRYEHNFVVRVTASAGACMSTEMGRAKENHRCEQADRKQCEYNRRAADDGADLFGFFSRDNGRSGL